jgi:sigma-E factor negative regulatory protein RseA
MNETGKTMNEKLSALMDDELTEFETRRVIDEVARNPGHRATWDRYHLVRATLRNELDIIAAPDLAERVASRLADTPVPAHRSLRATGTLAVAASVAAVAIIGLQWLYRPDSSPSTPVAKQSAPAATQVASTQGASEKARQAETERTLNAYLVEHNEFATAGMSGMLPYVRVVGHDTSK